MKIKILISIFALFIGFVGVNAQSLEITNAEDSIQGPEDGDPLKSHVTVTNTSDVTMNIMITATPISLTDGHAFFFCDLNTCWADQTTEFTSPMPNTLLAGENMDCCFYLGLNPNGVQGTSQVKVRFYEGDVSVDYTVTFTAGPIGVEVTWELADMQMFPNPASNDVNFEFNLKAAQSGDLEIYEESGRLVYRMNLNNVSGTQAINLNRFASGSYFYRIVSGIKSTPMRRLSVVK